jgi:large subunit ribosomal protein L21
MKYAVVKTGGKQYKISEGDILEVERLSLGDEKEISFDDVLLYTADGVVRVGTPMLSGIEIKATVLGQIKGKKIRVAKYKAKVRYRRVTGHRQLLTKVQISSIQAKGKAESPKKVEGPTEKKKAVKTVRPAK